MSRLSSKRHRSIKGGGTLRLCREGKSLLCESAGKKTRADGKARRRRCARRRLGDREDLNKDRPSPRIARFERRGEARTCGEGRIDLLAELATCGERGKLIGLWRQETADARINAYPQRSLGPKKKGTPARRAARVGCQSRPRGRRKLLHASKRAGVCFASSERKGRARGKRDPLCGRSSGGGESVKEQRHRGAPEGIGSAENVSLSNPRLDVAEKRGKG